MKEHKEKMVAPVVVTVLMILYYGFYFGLLVYLMDQMILKIVFGIIPLVFAALIIGVCVQRIHEIRGGEEDDLDQY